MCLRDGMLPVVLLGELLAGVALGAAWPRLTTPPGAQSQPVPTTAVLAPVAVPVAVAPVAVAPVAVAPVAVAPVAPVAVPVPVTVSVPVTAPGTAAVPAPAHTPVGNEPAARNPFFVLSR